MARPGGRARPGGPLSQVDVIDEITNKPRGSRTSLRLTPADIERTATHEAGHALAAFLGGSKGLGHRLRDASSRATTARSGSSPRCRTSACHLTRRDYEDKLDVFLAGRAAEELKYGKDGVSSGASSDLRAATELVTQMVTQLGLGGSGRLLWSESLSPSDVEIANSALTQSYNRVLARLKKNEGRLATLAQAMVTRQELAGDEVRAILEGGQAATRR